MIFPERVFGSSATIRIFLGLAISPISFVSEQINHDQIITYKLRESVFWTLLSKREKNKIISATCPGNLDSELFNSL
jgi:hypothetical protein